MRLSIDEFGRIENLDENFPRFESRVGSYGGDLTEGDTLTDADGREHEIKSVSTNIHTGPSGASNYVICEI